MEKKKLDAEIEATLNSLDGAAQAEIQPFFYTRLKAKLEERHAAPAVKLINLFSRPAVSFGILSCFLLLNVVTILTYKQQHSQGSSEGQTGLQRFALEYNMGVSTVYGSNAEK